MTLASLPPVPVVAPPETIPAAQPGAASAADRVAVGNIYGQVTNKITEDDPVELPDVIPLPPRRPHSPRCLSRARGRRSRGDTGPRRAADPGGLPDQRLAVSASGR